MNKYNFQVGDYAIATSLKGKIVKVTENYCALELPLKRMVRVTDGSLTWCLPIEEIEPIEITDEWLDLNFENYYLFPEYSDDKRWKSKDHRLTISTLSNMIGRDYDAKCLRKIHLDNEDFETIGGCASCYVHHIQHLCRDCEYEFEPKFK